MKAALGVRRGSTIDGIGRRPSTSGEIMGPLLVCSEGVAAAMATVSSSSAVVEEAPLSYDGAESSKVVTM